MLGINYPQAQVSFLSIASHESAVLAHGGDRGSRPGVLGQFNETIFRNQFTKKKKSFSQVFEKFVAIYRTALL